MVVIQYCFYGFPKEEWSFFSDQESVPNVFIEDYRYGLAVDNSIGVVAEHQEGLLRFVMLMS